MHARALAYCECSLTCLRDCVCVPVYAPVCACVSERAFFCIFNVDMRARACVHNIRVLCFEADYCVVDSLGVDSSIQANLSLVVHSGGQAASQRVEESRLAASRGALIVGR